MTTNHPSDADHSMNDEDRLRSLLSLIRNDSPEEETEQLTVLREELRTIFHAEHRNQFVRQSHVGISTSPRTFRGLAVLTAILSVVFAVLLLTPTQADPVPSLGDLVTSLHNTSALRIDVISDTGQEHLEFRSPGTVRWDDGPGHYRIADGHRLWKISDQSSEVVETESPLPAEGIDALTLLELSLADAETLSNVYPSGTELVDGRLLRVYSAHAVWKGIPVELRAYASPQAAELQLMRLLPANSGSDRGGDGANRRINPLAEIRLTASSESSASSTLQPARSLKDDGRSGLLVGVHGRVYIRSFPAHRWTPAVERMPVFAGDQIRCEAIGPHAVQVQLVDGTEVTAGPGAQLNLRNKRIVQLLTGEFMVISPVTESQFSVQASDGALLTKMLSDVSVDPGRRQILRVNSESSEVQYLEKMPTWLTTLEGTSSRETLGSLIAQVEGRDTSLTIGFHRVTVEVRDQIARTVIEESFVNNTNERLEGQFQFPLPHDASISGFGMWVGNELIEADIVEKQRAREIYEIILHEKRDPGLLEWMGGNLFKARVFPIEPHSEKKIRITYTQTLPMENGVYRYHYPLRSELLRKTPLRELSIDVILHSSRPLQSADSPSHPEATIDLTANAARLNWNARNVTPARDFEFVCYPAERQADVIAVPHLVDDEGYFMVQLSPPSIAAGNWSSPMVADGVPLDVIVLCDTSRSMDSAGRRNQSDLLTGILNCLAESDRVRLACCDNEFVWLQKEQTAVTPALRNALPELLNSRRSLGWSDLQAAFEEVYRQSQPGSVIVYIGDGTVVTDEPQARSRFLNWFSAKTRNTSAQPTCHAIGTGSGADAAVLNAIASGGRGTSRIVSESMAAGDIVRDLMMEISRPGLRRLSVEFRNVDVAAVYPRDLPNLPDGKQQILFGRFLPGQRDGEGEIIVKGLRGTEQVQYVARLPLSVPASGLSDSLEDKKTPPDNSFIPRQWAKAHLDHLLSEFPSPELQARIVQLSREYHLMTPYTSLLVLESDADRKRFGVEKTMQRSDGEKFFAEGREEAEYSLRQQELQNAKLWRAGLHQQMNNVIRNRSRLNWENVRIPERRDVGVTFHLETLNKVELYDSSMSHRFSTGNAVQYYDTTELNSDPSTMDEFSKPAAGTHWGYSLDSNSNGIDSQNFYYVPRPELFLNFGNRADAESKWSKSYVEEDRWDSSFDLDDLIDLNGRLLEHQDDFGTSVRFRTRGEQLSRGIVLGRYFRGFVRGDRRTEPTLARAEPPTFGLHDVLPTKEALKPRGEFNNLAKRLIPDVVHRSERQAATVAGSSSAEQESWRDAMSEWPAEVQDVLKQLERDFDLPVDGGQFLKGLQLRSVLKEVNPSSGIARDVATQTVHWAPQTGWLRIHQSEQESVLQWSIDNSSGALSLTTALGRVESLDQPPGDCAFPFEFPDNVSRLRSILKNGSQDARIVSLNGGDDRKDSDINSTIGEASNITEIVFTARTSPWLSVRIVVDIQKKCLLIMESNVDNVVIDRTEFLNHFQVGNHWVPLRTLKRTWDVRTKALLSQTQRDIELSLVGDGSDSDRSRTKASLSDDLKSLATQLNISKAGASRFPCQSMILGEFEISLPGSWLIIPATTTSLEDARKQMNGGSPDLGSVVTMTAEYADQGRWDEAFFGLKRGLDQHQLADAGAWLLWELLRQSRRNEDLSRELMDFTDKVIEPINRDSLDQTTFLLIGQELVNRLDGLLHQTKRDTLLSRFDAILESRQPGSSLRRTILHERAKIANNDARLNDELTIRRRIADIWPEDMGSQIQWLEALQARHQYEAIRVAYRSLLHEDRDWTVEEWESLGLRYVQWLRERGEFEEALTFCEDWIKRCAVSQKPYEQELQCLIELDRIEDVRSRLRSWFAVDEPIQYSGLAKLEAAMEFGFGRVGNLSLAGPQDEWRKEMLLIGERFAGSKRYFGALAYRVYQDGRIARSKDGQESLKRTLRGLRKMVPEWSISTLKMIDQWIDSAEIRGSIEHAEFLAEVRAVLDLSISEMEIDRIRCLLIDLHVLDDSNTSETQQEAWFQTLVTRFDSTEAEPDRSSLWRLIRDVDKAVFDREHQLKFLRDALKKSEAAFGKGAPENRIIASDLFATLLEHPWSQEVEDESFELILPKNAGDFGSAEWLIGIAGQYRVWLESTRRNYVAHLQAQVLNWESLPERNRQHLTQEYKVQSNRHVVQRVRSMTDGMKANRDPLSVQQSFNQLSERLLQQWWLVERLQLEQELVETDAAFGVSSDEKALLTEQILAATRCAPDQSPQATPEQSAQTTPEQVLKSAGIEIDVLQMLDLQLRHVFLTYWLQAAVELHEEGDPQEIEAILSYLRRGQELDTVAPRAWKAAEFGILIAIDRPQILETRLREWLRSDTPTAPWRVYLAQLLVELDRVEEAIQLYEEAGTKDLLTAAEWHQLSVWQHALDRRAASEASLKQEWKHMTSDDLAGHLSVALSNWSNDKGSRTPSAGADIREKLLHLAETTPSPSQAAESIGAWYQATHDPLLLRALVAFVRGRSESQLWETISGVQPVINKLEFEAAVVNLYSGIDSERLRLRTKESPVDRQTLVNQRALLLFEVIVSGRAAAMDMGSMQHEARCISAIDQLLSGDWKDGDRSAFASILVQLPLSRGDLQTTKIRTIRRLIQAEKAGSAERLKIVAQLVQQYRSQNLNDEAIELLESELRSVPPASIAQTPEFDGLFVQLCDILSAEKRFLLWERWVDEISPAWTRDVQRQRQFVYRMTALRSGAEVRLGSGEALYTAIRDELLSDLRSPDETGQILNNFERLMELYGEGNTQKLVPVTRDVRQFVDADLDRLIRIRSGEAASLIQRVSGILIRVNGRQVGLEFLLDRISRSPLAIQWTRPRDLWDSLSGVVFDETIRVQLDIEGENRIDIYPGARPLLPEVEAMLLKGLEATLVAGDSPASRLFDESASILYSRGAESVVEVLERVAAQQADKESHVLLCAEFLYLSQPNHRDRAIQILQRAFDEKRLTSTGKRFLMSKLWMEDRHEEAINVIDELIAEFPEDASLRMDRMLALHRAMKPDELKRELSDVLERLIQPKTADIGLIWSLADRCRKCELWSDAVALYDQGITRFGEPTQPDLQLSNAWRNLTECLGRLNQHERILTTISMAWVTCGNDAHQRNQIEQTLAGVLQTSQQLEAVSSGWTEAVAATGNDSSLIRRSLGRALLNNKHAETASEHLRIAVELQQQDAEAWTLLLQSVDQLNQGSEYLKLVQDQADAMPGKIELYQNLFERATKAGLPSLAERAASSIIETGPEESDHAKAMAELREESGNTDLAMKYWQRASDLKQEDPELLLMLLERHIRLGHQPEARQVFETLNARKWDARFGDVRSKAKAIRGVNRSGR
ncbi:MAG: hypothetical protein JNL58_14395 [Planctomyces sp.]|nr:hypothetical protein [Planctomyces sp.]